MHVNHLTPDSLPPTQTKEPILSSTTRIVSRARSRSRKRHNVSHALPEYALARLDVSLTCSARHPHPASVHFPIAFLALTCGLDIYLAVIQYQPHLAYAQFASNAEIAKAAIFVQTLGLLTAMPALVTGFASGIKSFSAGIYEGKDQNKRMRPKVKLTGLHALITTTAMLGNLILWNLRKATSLSQKGGLESAYTLRTELVIVEALLCGSMFFGAKQGGTLAFGFGMGFSRGQRAKTS